MLWVVKACVFPRVINKIYAEDIKFTSNKLFQALWSLGKSFLTRDYNGKSTGFT